MILLPISVLILTCFIAKAHTEILHCYECDDCKTSNDSFLRACPQIVSTGTPDNFLPETTTISPTTITATSSTTTSTTTEPLETTVPILGPEETTLVTVSSTPAPIAEVNEDEDTEKILKRSVRKVNYRALMIRRFAREIDVSHHCYIIKGFGGDVKKIKRGCVKVTGNKNACDVLQEQYDVPTEGCRACKENKCNNSAVRKLNFISHSVLLLFSIFLLKM